MQEPNPPSQYTQVDNSPSNATRNVSSNQKVCPLRPKETVIRTKNSRSVSAETMVAATSGTISKLFKFIPTPGLNQSFKK
ncbi:hypothetical protein HN873_060804 [Arachis hypogaea]